MNEKRWWLIVVAAVLAVLMVADFIGLTASVFLAVTALAAGLAYRLYRSRNPKPGPVLYCLGCGRTLPSTARQCRHCGSARWSMKN